MDYTPISIFWDYDNCSIPSEMDPEVVHANICSALKNLGYHGPVSFTAYGHFRTTLPSNTIDKLVRSGINLRETELGEENSVVKIMSVDMVYRMIKNPPPAIVLLVSGNGDFDYVLAQLVLQGYTIFIASSQRTTIEVEAQVCWEFLELANGKVPCLIRG